MPDASWFLLFMHGLDRRPNTALHEQTLVCREYAGNAKTKRVDFTHLLGCFVHELRRALLLIVFVLGHCFRHLLYTPLSRSIRAAGCIRAEGARKGRLKPNVVPCQRCRRVACDRETLRRKPPGVRSTRGLKLQPAGEGATPTVLPDRGDLLCGRGAPVACAARQAMTSG